MVPHLAQLNIGRLLAPTDDPRVAGFMDNIDRINDLAERVPGFVWRMKGSEEPNAGNTETKIAGDPRFISNLSVWESVEALERFVWGTLHRRFYERRAEWFEVMGRMHFVLWWVPAGTEPTLEEALERLDHLETKGDSDRAFGWRHLPQARLWRETTCAQGAA